MRGGAERREAAGRDPSCPGCRRCPAAAAAGPALQFPLQEHGRAGGHLGGNRAGGREQPPGAVLHRRLSSRLSAPNC